MKNLYDLKRFGGTCYRYTSGRNPRTNKDGINGLVVNPKDAKALSQAILTLEQSKEKRIEMGTGSLEQFNRLFLHDKVVGNYITLYKEVGKRFAAKSIK